MAVDVNKAGEGFEYYSDPQGSPEWVARRIGKVTASELTRWLSLSKRDGVTPLQARKDYERELSYEKQFGVPFSRFVTAAMEEGRIMESFLRSRFEQIMNVTVHQVGSYGNDKFIASPDGIIESQDSANDALVEFKWLGDNSFSGLLRDGVPHKYMLQMQGQMLATGRDKCFLVAGNRNSGKIKVIEERANKEVQDLILESLKVDVQYEDLSTTLLFELGEIPENNISWGE